MIYTLTLENTSKRLAHLQSEIERINKKLTEKIKINVGYPYVESVGTLNYEFVQVELYCDGFWVDGENKAFAKIEHTNKGNIITQFAYKTIDLTKYYHAESNCDVCEHDRYRKITYLACNPKGEILQIGSTCIQDVTRLEAIVTFHELIQDYVNLDENDIIEMFPSNRRMWEIGDIIEIALGFVKTYGFVSKSKAEWDQTPTAQHIEDYLFDHKKQYSDILNAEIEQAEIYVSSILDSWPQLEGDNNSFKHSLSVLAQLKYVDEKRFGFICAGVNMWWTAQNKAKNDNELRFDNTYFGVIGTRYDKKNALVATLVKVNFSAYTVQGFGYYGVETAIDIYTLQNEAGQALVIKASSDAKYAQNFLNEDGTAKLGSTFQMNATVKEHKNYNGLFQTVLQRPGKVSIV